MITVYTIQIFNWEWIHFECEIQNNSGISLNWFCYRLLSNTIECHSTLTHLFLYSFSEICHPGFISFFNSTHNLYSFDWIENWTWLAVYSQKKDQGIKNRIYDFLIEEFYFDSKFGMYIYWFVIHSSGISDWREKAKKTVSIATLK